jgi:hypothetical protein
MLRTGHDTLLLRKYMRILLPKQERVHPLNDVLSLTRLPWSNPEEVCVGTSHSANCGPRKELPREEFVDGREHHTSERWRPAS